MTPRQITETYHVAPQLSLEEAAGVAAAGYRTVICNRPDGENPPNLAADAIRKVIEAQGVAFHTLPFDQTTLTLDIAAEQRRLIEEAQTPILAYCASGNRCTVVWSLGEAMRGSSSVADMIAAGAAAGYNLYGLQATLEDLVAQR